MDHSAPASLADTLQALITAQGMSIRQLESDSLISKTTLLRKLRMPSKFTMDELGRLAKALGTTAGALVAESESDAA